jgi:hypothetical protein
MNAEHENHINVIKPGVEMEYNALRNEVLKRIELGRYTRILGRRRSDSQFSSNEICGWPNAYH